MTNAFCAALAIMAVMPSAIAEGWVVCHAIDGVSRNPEMYGKLRTMMILGVALCETTAIYALLISILCLFIA